jgi:hypothetical protein
MDQITGVLNMVREEIRENLPYKVVHIEGCEADDVIGTLVENTNEFGNFEPVMIISADKDFAQLQKYEHVAQFSPLTKKLIKEPNARLRLAEHIIKGDAGDGIPNIFSADDVFVEGLRQTPASKKKVETVLEFLDKTTTETPSWWRNFQRNEMLIDLTRTPSHLKEAILESYNNQDPWHNMKIIMHQQICNVKILSLHILLKVVKVIAYHHISVKIFLLECLKELIQKMQS